MEKYKEEIPLKITTVDYILYDNYTNISTEIKTSTTPKTKNYGGINNYVI